MIGKNEQPRQIVVCDEIVLVKYYPYYGRSFGWYQDQALCRQVDNIDHVYDMDRLKRMYRYLSTKGECYYVKFRERNGWRLVGDISLCNGEISIVICREYQNRHIGRRAILALAARAKDLRLSSVGATIYAFNRQSQRAFEAAGFRRTEEEKFVMDLQ